MVTSGKLRAFQDDPLNNLRDAVDYLLSEKDYKSTVFPSIVSYNKGRNFWIKKYRPGDYEKEKIIHIIVTGVSLQSFIRGNRCVILTNIDGLTLNERKSFVTYLIKQKSDKVTGDIYPAIEWGRLSGNTYGTTLRYWGSSSLYTYIYSFAVVTQFARWMFLREELKPQDLVKRRLDLITIVAGKSIQNEYTIIPGISSFIVKWYEDLYSEDVDVPALGRFIRSFYDSSQEDKSLSTINKFLYYLLNGYVSGDLLNTLVMDKTTSFLKEVKDPKRKGRLYGVSGAGFFFDRV